ncbi:Asparagine synthetase domain-containing protein, partial [Zostera marina]
MCGIALILSDVSIIRPDLVEEQSSDPLPNDEHEISFVPDLTAALLRRGPDCLGEKKVLVNLRCAPVIPISNELSHPCTKTDNCNGSSFLHHQNVILNSTTKRDDKKKSEKGGLLFEKGENNITSVHEITFPQYVTSNRLEFSMELHFIGATLHLRGVNPVQQPLIDSFGNILIYN